MYVLNFSLLNVLNVLLEDFFGSTNCSASFAFSKFSIIFLFFAYHLRISAAVGCFLLEELVAEFFLLNVDLFAT